MRRVESCKALMACLMAAALLFQISLHFHPHEGDRDGHPAGSVCQLCLSFQGMDHLSPVLDPRNSAEFAQDLLPEFSSARYSSLLGIPSARAPPLAS